jgi:hypothetical protein
MGAITDKVSEGLGNFVREACFAHFVPRVFLQRAEKLRPKSRSRN